MDRYEAAARAEGWTRNAHNGYFVGPVGSPTRIADYESWQELCEINEIMPLIPIASYYVLDGHTLGFVYDEAPTQFNVLHGSVLKGGHDWKNGCVHISPVCKLEPATLADFEEFGVSPKGHIA